MDNLRQEILDKSNEVIWKLSELAAFFEEPTLIKICLQSKIIHKLFEDNADIDINKLELFHLQFSDTLINLLEKIKVKNERIVGMYKHEMELNNEMIEKIKQRIVQDGGFDAEAQKQTVRMSKSLRDLYTAIYYKSTDYPFKEDINSFSINFYKDHFFESEQEIVDKLIMYDKSKVYRNPYAVVDKQLLLELGQANFDVRFFAGVKVYPILLEIYKIQEKDIYFLYWPVKNLFLKCDIDLFPHEKWVEEMSKKAQAIKSLTKKNSKLETNIKNTHKYLSYEISELLDEDYKVITGIDFLASLEDIDTQANILKAMLETKMI
ncbi:hypothetical protein [Dysgonomonas sp. 520]|uniref:hypothetical protein n=1 Tax=Dysgonomonas sp. 520 TaxID=2302931 RepID=UPI0013D81740|nr:hypothetical protein [Dysgonomonas sp. 520]NDW10517.1 hypothetical protein [Dysgonomonas sp. 520]